ncbi:Nn.00g050170.m01.CDS01 [Neocucurbitaria sp. VM-36]
MPDNKGVGWRKKIHGSKPKDAPPLKTGGDDTAAAEDSSGRRRHHGWRKTMHGSRPETPVSGALMTPAMDDVEDARSERSEMSTTHRNSKPKLARYTSLFNSLKESPKGPEFAEPWSEDFAPPFQPYIDPLDTLQSIRSHMNNCSLKPIPPEHNNGLFRLFEDYGRVMEEKEKLKILLQDTFQGWKAAEDYWSECESRYEAEIRRLDLLIARGTSGMTGLITARQGSVINRKRRYRKTISNDRLESTYELLSPEHLDKEIELQSQRGTVLLHRPMSPSGKMAALSKQFTRTNIDLPIGNPPDENKNMTLSRKVQSELNLTAMAGMEVSQSSANSMNSSSSGSSEDALSKEVTISIPACMESAIECDAFIALRELGTLIARRRGLRADCFIENLMILFSNTGEAGIRYGDTAGGLLRQTSMSYNSGSTGKPSNVEASTTSRTLRKFQSQPQLSSDQRRRRHFSFEPGDDQLEGHQEEIKLREARGQDSDSSAAETQPSHRLHISPLQSHLADSQSSSHALFVDFQKPSKIPSPVQIMGRVRRENSASSLQSIYARPDNDRRDSRSSVATAFRESSSGSLRLNPESRGSSMRNSFKAGFLPLPKESNSDLRFGNSLIALAAARAAEKTSLSKGD